MHVQKFRAFVKWDQKQFLQSTTVVGLTTQVTQVLTRWQQRQLKRAVSDVIRRHANKLAVVRLRDRRKGQYARVPAGQDAVRRGQRYTCSESVEPVERFRCWIGVHDARHLTAMSH